MVEAIAVGVASSIAVVLLLTGGIVLWDTWQVRQQRKQTEAWRKANQKSTRYSYRIDKF